MSQTLSIAGVALGVTLAAACTNADVRAIDPAHEAAVRSAGGRAADALIAGLGSHLAAALSQGGPAAAVEFCSTRAIELTAGVSDAEGLEMKRTSLRYRNPANAPDQHETEALRYFEAALDETRVLPDAWVQRVDRDEYRYYRPLTVAPPCLTCHGSAAKIDPSVAEILEERYPGDVATGYAPGDLRGVIRVSIPTDRIQVPQ